MKHNQLDKFYVFDIETITEDNIYNIRKFRKYTSMPYQANGCNLSRTDEVEFVLTSSKEDEIITNILNYIKTKQIQAIMFHNLSFDGTFLINVLTRIDDYEICNSREHFAAVYRVKKACLITELSSKIFKITISYLRDRQHYNICNITCSYLKTQTSVAKTKSGKLVYNHKTVNPWKLTKKERKYCKQDVDSVINHIHLITASKTSQIVAFVNALTLSQMSFKKVEKKEKELVNNYHLTYEDSQLYINLETYKKFESSYRGGYSNYNRSFLYIFGDRILPFQCPKGISLDINTSYSYEMSKELPVKEITKSEYQKLQPHHRTILYSLAIHNIRQKVNGISIFYKTDFQISNESVHDKYIMNEHIGYKQNKRFMIFDFELEYFNKFHFNSGDYTILDKHYFECQKIDCLCETIAANMKKIRIDTELRDKYQHTDEDRYQEYCGLRDFHKLENNAIYGKTCQRPNKPSNILVKNPNLKLYDQVEEYGITYTILKKKEHRYNDYYAYEAVSDKSVKYAKNIILGSFITAKARVHIYKHIWLNKEIWFKSDTDSLFFTDETKLHPETLAEIGPNLGQFKREYQFTRAIVPSAKAYQLELTNGKFISKAAGFNNKSLNEYVNNLPLLSRFILGTEILLEDINTQKKRTKYGISLVKVSKLYKPYALY